MNPYDIEYQATMQWCQNRRNSYELVSTMAEFLRRYEPPTAETFGPSLALQYRQLTQIRNDHFDAFVMSNGTMPERRTASKFQKFLDTEIERLRPLYRAFLKQYREDLLKGRDELARMAEEWSVVDGDGL